METTAHAVIPCCAKHAVIIGADVTPFLDSKRWIRAKAARERTPSTPGPKLRPADDARIIRAAAPHHLNGSC